MFRNEIMIMSEFRSEREGFVGMLGHVESIMEARGFTPPPELSLGNVAIRYEGISMPAFLCVNYDGAGPGIIRPWVGAPKDEGVGSIQADLRLGIADQGQEGQLLLLGIDNFKTKPTDGRPVRGIAVGRPISEHSNFGMPPTAHEAYTALVVKALVRGDITVRSEVVVTDIDGVEGELFMETRGLKPHQQPAQLLGGTCILAASRTSKQPYSNT